MNILSNLRKRSLVAVTGLALAGSLAAFVPAASAAPFHGFRGGGVRGGGGYRGGGYRGGGWGPGAVIGGLALGALAGAASGYYGAPYYYGPGYYPGCYPVRQRVWTGWGWAWRVVQSCY